MLCSTLKPYSGYVVDCLDIPDVVEGMSRLKFYGHYRILYSHDVYESSLNQQFPTRKV